MSSVPSGPKPTKETYLATLRILKEHQQNTDEDRTALRNSPIKSKMGQAVLCTEEVILAAETIKASAEPSNKSAASIILGAKSSSTKGIAQPVTTQPTPVEAPTVQKPAPETTKTVTIVESPTKSVTIAPSQQSFKSPVQSGVSQKIKQGQTPAAPVSPTPEEVVKLGRKANRRFTQVLTVLPNVRLDKSMKLKVATELKKMDCWSDDEPDESASLGTIHDESEESSDSDEEAITPVLPTNTSGASVKISGKSSKNLPSASAKITTTAATPAGNMKSDGKSGKVAVNAYLQQQKEEARRKAKETIVKKAVKVYVKLRKDEHDRLHKSHWATTGKLAVEKAVREKIATFRVNRILTTAFASAVEKRIKIDKRERRRQIKRDAAQRRILKAWKKFRARFLLGCVIEYIRLKAQLFRESARLEDRNFRMRTAMRRVKEDGIFKEWMEEQRANPTFPVKPHPPQASAESNVLASKVKKTVNNDVHIHVTPAFARRNNLHVFFEKEAPSQPPPLSPRAPVSAPGAGGNRSSRKQSTASAPSSGTFFLTQSADSASNSVDAPEASASSRAGSAAPRSANNKAPPSARTAVPATASATPPVVQTADFIFNRPDLAPFSTMINQLITGSMLYQAKQTQSWVDIASVSADYGETFKQKKKSPAYSALEKFCGISEADVVRSQLTSHSEGVSLKLKSFGHSIVSL